MKSYSEYRAAAWKSLREGGWVTKYLVVVFALMAVFGVFQCAWAHAVETMGIQTWSMFFEAKLKAMSGGLDLAVPSRAVAVGMTEASAFELFVSCILNGIFSFAATCLFLRAAGGERTGWFGASFGGFKRPLGVAWLYFRYVLQISLWALLFVVPGIVAYYRYCQSWNLKVENPDWSAGKCLAESCRMMVGHKAQCFALDMSYWKPITLILTGFLAVVVLVGLMELGILPGLSAPVSMALFAILIVSFWGGLVLWVYLSIGHALFYLDLKTESAEKTSVSC